MNNKLKKRIFIDRLFPNVSEMNLYHKLKINQESIMYITIPEDAEQITKIIVNHILKYFPDSFYASITDATAGVGGNTISFSQKFKCVNAIELDQERFNYLSNNINAYQISNVNLYNNDCQNVIPNLGDNDIIFIDPPWGGKNYKNINKIRLSLNDNNIEDICINFFNKEKMISIPKLIVIKLPKNYDIQYIYKKIKIDNDQPNDLRKIYFYELNKMIIIVIENGFYSLPSSNKLF